MIKFVGRFLRAIGASMIVLGFVLTSNMLIADDPGDPGTIPTCKKTVCNIDCESIQSQSGLCIGQCHRVPIADCGGCNACGEFLIANLYNCLCVR